MCVTWLIHVCDVTHSCVWRDSFMCVTWLIHVCDSFTCVTHSYVWHDSFTCVTHSCVWHDSFRSRAWLIQVCDMTQSFVWELDVQSHLMDSCTCGTWLTQVCDMAHSCVWHDSFMCVTWFIGANKLSHYGWVCLNLSMRHGTRMNASCNKYEYVMSHMTVSVTHKNIYICIWVCVCVWEREERVCVVMKWYIYMFI